MIIQVILINFGYKNSLEIIHVHFYDYLLRIDVDQCDQSYTHWSKWLLGV